MVSLNGRVFQHCVKKMQRNIMENISQVPLLDTGCNCDVYASDWWYQALHILVNSDI